jgi:hypothetical protein
MNFSIKENDEEISDIVIKLQIGFEWKKRVSDARRIQ